MQNATKKGISGLNGEGATGTWKFNGNGAVGYNGGGGDFLQVVQANWSGLGFQ